jgi:hypothetical protein
MSAGCIAKFWGGSVSRRISDWLRREVNAIYVVADFLVVIAVGLGVVGDVVRCGRVGKRIAAVGFVS